MFILSYLSQLAIFQNFDGGVYVQKAISFSACLVYCLQWYQMDDERSESGSIVNLGQKFVGRRGQSRGAGAAFGKLG